MSCSAFVIHSRGRMEMTVIISEAVTHTHTRLNIAASDFRIRCHNSLSVSCLIDSDESEEAVRFYLAKRSTCASAYVSINYIRELRREGI